MRVLSGYTSLHHNRGRCGVQVRAIQRTVPAAQRSALSALVCALRAVTPNAAGVVVDSMTQLVRDVQQVAAYPATTQVRRRLMMLAVGRRHGLIAEETACTGSKHPPVSGQSLSSRSRPTGLQSLQQCMQTRSMPAGRTRTRLQPQA